ncbi:ParB/RepB/Spo0J family partition protein [Sphingomonas sp. TREG-RG-20F-R18-01]|uniref:ParB/RepB/Spo0J family partition protein n=1 Tax=Sphingomonas sp. TREG-RG-20F-R18-01 TaxID=2914982 RepID=UPI001F56EF29|nr:ParB/RepB/Spo0J family partition protein [Sphingomonas sp. TREG-RG-20F-R18-01]
MTISNHTIDQLRLSHLNVRTNEEDANATEGLQASILQHGLFQPLIVHPMKGNKGKFAVLAGGRRYRAIRRLVDNGDLPMDWPIDTVVRNVSDREIIELSLAENLLRRQLRPYEIYAAVAKAQRRGATAEEIAKHFGQSLKAVRQWMRLSNLEATIFEAYASGKLSHDQACAYAATEDQALQRMAYDQLAAMPEWQAKPATIRQLMKIGDREAEKLLRFVGLETYRAAGGIFELDLFADDAEMRGRADNDGLLRQLADAKLEVIREEIRHRANRPVRFGPSAPRDEYGTTWRLEVKAGLSAMDEATTVRLEQLQAEQNDLEEQGRNLLDGAGDVLPGSEEALAQINARYDPNEAEIADIEAGRAPERKIVLPDGDIYGTVEITAGGGHELRWWWASDKAKAGKGEKEPAGKSLRPISADTVKLHDGDAIRGSGSEYQAIAAANAVAKDQHGLTEVGVQVMRSLRREVMRATLVENAHAGKAVGHDYFIWAQLRMSLGSDRASRIGARAIGTAFESIPEAVNDHLEMSLAHSVWEGALREISAQSFMTEKNLQAALIDYLNASPALKNLAAAVLAGLALERSANVDGYRVPVHDAVAHMTARGYDAAVRRLVDPTAEMVDLLPKAQRLAIAEPLVEPATFKTWRNLKAPELAPLIIRVLLGTARSIRSNMRRAAESWVHPLIQFAPIDPAAIAVADTAPLPLEAAIASTHAEAREEAA